MKMFTEQSQWIWLDASDAPNRYMETCERFSARAGQRAELRLSVEGQLVAFLNGERVEATQHSDFPFAKAVQTPDVTALLREGVNELRIQCWYPGVDTSVTRKEQPGLRYELRLDGEVALCSNAKTLVRPIAEYQDGKIPNITGQLGWGFERRFAAPAEWKPAFVTDKQATTIPRPILELDVQPPAPSRMFAQGVFAYVGGRDVGEEMQSAGLYWRDVKTMAQLPKPEYIPMTDGVRFPSEAGVTFRAEGGDGIWLCFDMGTLHEGYLTLDLVCPEPSRLDVGFGEHYEDLRIRTSVGGRCFGVKLTAPAQRQPFTHWFRRLGCRYIQLFVHAHEVTVYAASVRPVVYPLDARPELVPGDYLHQRIAEVSRKTLISCMHDHYEDCPWREQALYAFDSRNQMLAGYYAFGEFRFPRENLRLLAHSQREDGMLELCAPARIPITIPSFSMAFIMAVEEYCRYSGDLEFGREMLPVAERILDALRLRVHDGFAWRFKGEQYWNFYEWQPLLEGYAPCPEDSAEAGLQLFGILALQRMAALRKMAGSAPRECESEMLSELTGGLEKFWDEEAGAYASFIWDGKRVQSAELIQSLALYAGVCPEPRAAALREKLRTGDGLVPVTLSYSLFKYEALLQDPAMAEGVFDEIARRWGDMLFKGAVTFWEVDEGAAAFDRAGSLCHAWSSIPLYLYGAYVLGVRPEKPGVWTAQEPSPVALGMRGVLGTPEGHFAVRREIGQRAGMEKLD